MNNRSLTRSSFYLWEGAGWISTAYIIPALVEFDLKKKKQKSEGPEQ